MRKLILLSTCAICFAFSSANAQLLGAAGGGATEATQIISWAKQQADSARQLTQLYNQYQMMTRTFNAISSARDMGSLVSALGSPVRTYLPEAGDTLDLVGSGARMLNGANSIKSADSIFRALPQAARSVETGARWAEEMRRSEDTTANVKAMAQQGVTDMRSRMLSLNAAQARLAVASDLQDVATIQATIATAQTNLQQHQVTLQNMQLLLHAADRTDAARERQLAAESSARWANSTRGAIEQLQGD